MAQREIIFGSVCSGLDAASLAWNPLGWRAAFISEIEAAPISVLKHRHGAVDQREYRARANALAPLLWGDFSALRPRHLKQLDVAIPDVLVGGTPCQAFSLAGKRKSLADARGNLSLAFVKLAHAIDRQREREGKPGLVVVWENVPGALTTSDNAFGCLVGGFVGADHPVVSPHELGRWPDSGLASGPRAWAAWRILDAQHFRLAQRRRRVLLVVGFRNVLDPATVLFEPASLRGHSAPGGEAYAHAAASPGDGAARGRGDGELVSALDTRRDGVDDNDAQAGHIVPMLAMALNAKGDSSRLDASSETFITHALRGEGFDAGEDGSGRGTPIVPVIANPLLSGGHSNNPLDENLVPVAFSSKDYGQDALDDLSPTLRAGGHHASHPNAGVPPAVAVPYTLASRGRGDGHELEFRQDGIANAILTPNGGRAGMGVGAVAALHEGWQWLVRRLMPIECERLQGEPDNFTLVPHCGKPMADGPRYKMIGNSMAVRKMAWLGARIDAVLRGLPLPEGLPE